MLEPVRDTLDSITSQANAAKTIEELRELVMQLASHIHQLTQRVGSLESARQDGARWQ